MHFKVIFKERERERERESAKAKEKKIAKERRKTNKTVFCQSELTTKILSEIKRKRKVQKKTQIIYLYIHKGRL